MAHVETSASRGILKIVLFFTLLVGLLFLVDWAVNFGLRRIRTSAFGVSNLAVTGKANADIVISGSSRAQTHYDPRVLETITGHTAFNIGRNGSQTDMQVAFLKTYLKHNTKPKLVIHNLDLFSFLTSHEIYDPAQYLPYLKEGDIFLGIQRVYPDAWKWRCLPLYGYLVEDMRFTWLQGLKGLVGLQPREDYFRGYLPRHTPWTGEFDRFRQHNPKGIKFGIEPQGVRDMRTIGEICRERDIPLLFVYSPEFHEMQLLENDRGEIFARFHELCREFQVPLWDYSSSPISQDEANFYNSQHLNANGADKFSADLAQRLVSSGLLR